MITIIIQTTIVALKVARNNLALFEEIGAFRCVMPILLLVVGAINYNSTTSHKEQQK